MIPFGFLKKPKMTSVSIKTSDSFVTLPPPYFMSTGQLTDTERKCLEVQSPEELAKSKFDLPVEFHIEQYETWLKSMRKIRNRQHVQAIKIGNEKKNFGKYILSQKTSVMYMCENQKPNRKSRFEYLKEDVFLQALERRPNFKAIRYMAIQVLRSHTLTKLNIIAENEFCPNINDIPHKLFSWSPDDYYHRRDLPNMVWLEVYERDFKDCLQTQKFKCDLKEICRYLDIILCGALTDSKDFSFEYQVVQPLEDASDLLSIYTRLKSELQENRQFVAELRTQYGAAEIHNLEIEERNRANIMGQMADINMLFPVQYRYQKGWYEAQVDQVEMEQEKALTKLNENVNDWNFKILQENSAMQNTLNMYYSEIEYYKTETSEYNVKFESEYDDLENAINYKRLSMNKLELQRKFYEEHIDVMLEKIAEYNVRKKVEEEERVLRIRQQAEANLMKLAKADEKQRKKTAQLEKNKNKKKRK